MQASADAVADGLAHHRAGRWELAAGLYRKALSTDPGQPNALYLYGVLLAGLGETRRAAMFLERAVETRPWYVEGRLALANLRHRLGDVEGACAGWRDVLRLEPGHEAASLNLAGQQRATRDWRGAVATCRMALAERPHCAAVWVSLAASLLAGQVFEAALTAADAALELEAGLAEAWLIRGTVLARARCPEALDAFGRALELDPGLARAELHLGNALLDLDRLDEAERHIRRAIDLAPDLAEAHTSLGFLQSSRHHLSAAVACHERAVALQPDFAEAHSNLSAALLLAGEYERGWAEYEWRKRNPIFAACYWQSTKPEWAGEPLHGKTILVFGEQGLGDALMCARYLPVLAERGARIVLICAPALLSLLATLPGVVAVLPRGDPLAGDRIAAGVVVPEYDTWIDQMSLPRVLGTRSDHIIGAAGYLRADPALLAEWRARLPPGRKIGLVWAGNPAHHNDRRRSMPAAALRPLLEHDACFVSLQCGPAARDAAALGLLDLGGTLRDMAQTAAVLGCLDLVIGVDTSVAHLAGAMGVPCLVLLPYAPEWRWMIARADSPWYDSLRLIRQPAAGDWGGVTRAVLAELADRAEQSRDKPC